MWVKKSGIEVTYPLNNMVASVDFGKVYDPHMWSVAFGYLWHINIHNRCKTYGRGIFNT